MNENQLIESIREEYGEWLEIAKDEGRNPETIVSLVLARRYLKLKQQYEICDYVKKI